MYAERRRPAWVWIISIFYFLSIAWALLALSLVVFGRLPLNPAQQAYFSRLGTLDWIVSLAIVGCNLGGAVALLMLRKQAPYLFLVGLVISLAQIAWQVQSKSLLALAGGSGLIGLIASPLIALAVIAYGFHLRNRRILR